MKAMNPLPTLPKIYLSGGRWRFVPATVPDPRAPMSRRERNMAAISFINRLNRELGRVA